MWVIQSVSCHLSKKWLSQTRMSLIVTNFENVDTVWRVTKTWRILCQKPFWLCKRIVSYHIASSDKSKKRCEDESVSWELFLSQSETEKQWKKLSLRVTGCLAVVFLDPDGAEKWVRWVTICQNSMSRLITKRLFFPIVAVVREKPFFRNSLARHFHYLTSLICLQTELVVNLHPLGHNSRKKVRQVKIQNGNGNLFLI